MLRFILIILLAALTSFMPSLEKKEMQDITRSYNYSMIFDIVTNKEGDWKKSYNEFTFKTENIIHYSTTYGTIVYKILGNPRKGTNPYGHKYTDYSVVYGGDKYQVLLWDSVNRGVWVWLEGNLAIEFNNPK